jgi:hypothetical protein
MIHNTKAIRISLLHEQIDALAELSRKSNQSLSETLIKFLQTTNLNVHNDTTTSSK